METKKSQCLKAISTYYLNCKPNVRINNSIFWTSMTFSRGTVYSCINELQKAGAVEIKNSTKRGSYINKINYGKLFQYAQNKKVIFVLPLPSTKNIRIISTALDNVFKIKKIPMEIIYKPGSERRADFIKEGVADICLVTKMTAIYLKAKDSIYNLVNSLGQNSFTQFHGILFSTKNQYEIKDNMKVGIDYNSVDITLITKNLTKSKKVKFVEKKYNTLVENLKNKEIDALVYNPEALTLSGKNIVPVKDFYNEFPELVNSTIASFVTNKKNNVINNVMNNIVTKEIIIKEIERIKQDPLLMNY